MSELLWVAVPGGSIVPTHETRERDGAVLRVLVVPRLSDVPTRNLDDHGIGNWPAILADVDTLLVELATGPDSDITPVSGRVERHAQPKVWDAFFPSGTALTPFEARTIDEPDVAQTSVMANKVVDTYWPAAMAQALDVSAQAAVDRRGADVTRRMLAAWRDDRRDEPAPRASRALADDDDGGERSGAGSHDLPFHRTVAMLREHPLVLRGLGLIVELVLDSDDIEPAVAGSPRLVRVRWPDAHPSPTIGIVSPWTAYQFDGRVFLPAPRAGSIITAGMVDLTGVGAIDAGAPRAWGIATFDVDGAAARLRSAASSGEATPQDGPSRRPAVRAERPSSVPSLPTLRSAGLVLLRRDRQRDFADRRKTAAHRAARESLDGEVLTAEDLVLGYRADVHDGTGWLPLGLREATYTVNDITIGPGREREDAHVKANAATRDADGATRATEVVLRWDGWSLAVPRPAFGARRRPSREGRRAPTLYRFDRVYDLIDEMLPQLRFGHTYQLRLRVADVAGGGLEFADSAADRCATRLVRYSRYEPIPPPFVQSLTTPGPGASVDLLVIRSDRDQTATEFAQRDPRYNPVDRRDLLPPATSLEIAEQHGRLEEADERTLRLVQRAGATDRDPMVPSARRGVPWLPDPASRGIAAYLRPGPGVHEPGPKRDAWTGVWPDVVGKVLELTERVGQDGQLAVDGERVTVRLGQAEQVTLEVSSFLDDDALDDFAIRAWLGAPPPDPTGHDADVMPSDVPPDAVPPETLDLAASGGRHPMVTPPRVLRLVHAVQRPLVEPTGSLSVARRESQTYADLVPDPADLRVHAASTVQLDISARWSEWGDGPEPRTSADAPVQSVTVPDVADALPALRHEFGDTKHRKVDYTLTAVSRFRQFFAATDPDDAFRVRTALPTVSIPSSARPPAPVVLSAMPAFAWSPAEPRWMGDVLVRSRGGSKVRLQLAPPWYATGEGEQLGVVVTPDGWPPEALWPSLTQCGRDPIWDTTPPDQWVTPDAFAPLQHTPITVVDAETKLPVVVVPHDVWFDSGSWYADVDLSPVARTSYAPFVRLAVARFQPESVSHLELSPIVTTDMVPLLADRTLTVRRDSPPGNRSAGPGEGRTEGESGRPTPRRPPRVPTTRVLRDPTYNVTLSGLDQGLSGVGNRVDVCVEEFVGPDMLAGVVDVTGLGSLVDAAPAWRAIHRQSGLLNQPIVVPQPNTSGAYRLRVREVEPIATSDPEAAEKGGPDAEMSERTVFLDVVPIFGPPAGKFPPDGHIDGPETDPFPVDT